MLRAVLVHLSVICAKPMASFHPVQWHCLAVEVKWSPVQLTKITVMVENSDISSLFFSLAT